jgi:hypothetical protein
MSGPDVHEPRLAAVFEVEARSQPEGEGDGEGPDAGQLPRQRGYAVTRDRAWSRSKSPTTNRSWLAAASLRASFAVSVMSPWYPGRAQGIMVPLHGPPGEGDMLLTIAALLLLQGTAPAPPAAPKALEPLSFLLGDWQAQGGGKPGEASGGFSFAPQLQERVIVPHERRAVSSDRGQACVPAR